MTTATREHEAIAQAEVTRQQIAAIADLFAESGDPREVALFAWQYANGIGTRDFMNGAYVGDTLSALYATAQYPLWCDGHVTEGLQSLDTLTGPRLRGKGMFTQLAARTFAEAEAGGQRLVFGFPNGSSQKGFFGKLGWTRYGSAPFLIRPLSTSFVSQRFLDAKVGFALPSLPLPTWPSRAKLVTLQEVVASDALWQGARAQIGCAVDRSAAYLRWRLARPGADYRAVACWRGGKISAFAVYRVAKKHGAQIGYLMEVMHLPADRMAGVEVVAGALAAMQKEGANVALAWNLPHSFNAWSYRANAFVPLPARMRPIELHFGAKALNGVLPSVSDWYVSYLDSDTV